MRKSLRGGGRKRWRARAVGLAFLVGAPAAAQHPDIIASPNSDQSLEWRSASSLLDSNGLPRDDAPDRFRDSLTKSIEWFDQQDLPEVLEDGYTASRAGCRIFPPAGLIPHEIADDFSSILLLTEVTASAVVSETVPGFFASGSPALLVHLEDVRSLRPAPLPSYVLMPVGQYVVNGRLFCRPRIPNELVPSAGAEVVVLGGITAPNVVRLGDRIHTGSLGIVDRQADRITWRFMGLNGPRTVSGLMGRVDEAQAGGLFDVARPVAVQPLGSPDRLEFSTMWVEYHGDGCRIREAEVDADGALVLTRVCNGTEHRIVP